MKMDGSGLRQRYRIFLFPGNSLIFAIFGQSFFENLLNTNLVDYLETVSLGLFK